MPIPDGEPTPERSTEPIKPESTEKQPELTQDQATEIFNKIVDEVKKGLGSWVGDYLLLEHDVERDGIMVLIDKAVQIITELYIYVYVTCLLGDDDKNTSSKINSSNLGNMFENYKSKIAVCVAFLCYACDRDKVGNKEVAGAVKELLSNTTELKSKIQEIIEFMEGKDFNDPNVARIEIDGSYKVTIEIVGGSSIEYTLDW